MPKVEREGQPTLNAEALQVEDDVVAAFQTKLANKRAYSEYNKAAVKIRHAIPPVKEKTSFLVNEEWLVTASPYDAEGHEVSGGHRQRNKVERLGDD